MSERKAKYTNEPEETSMCEFVNENRSFTNDQEVGLPSNKLANESDSISNQYTNSFKSKLNISKKFLLKKEKCVSDEGSTSNLNMQLGQQTNSLAQNQDKNIFQSDKKDFSADIDNALKQTSIQQQNVNVTIQNKLRKNSSSNNNQVILSKDYSNRAMSRSSLVPGLTTNSGAPSSGAYHHPMRRESFLYKSDNVEFDNKNRSASIGSE
jgi:hypothetical protein